MWSLGGLKGSVVLTVGSGDGHGLAKAVETGRREELGCQWQILCDLEGYSGASVGI